MSDDHGVPGPTPNIAIEVVADHSDRRPWDDGFLRMRRLTLRNRYPDGRSSRAYDYDVVERTAMDAVGIVLHADGEAGPVVCLRSSLRPPLAFRPGYSIPIPDEGQAVLWEIPAGLVEPKERGEQGLQRCAARETQEEVGLSLPPASFSLLGPGACLSPGVLGEKIYFLAALVEGGGWEAGARAAPAGDGTPTEEGAELRFVPLAHALQAVRDGTISDLKTEVALRRLAEVRGVR